MGECFLNQSGGGGSLNFKVKDYATEELLMAATGKDNEIGIITSTPMTGWYMAAEQPENMQPGEVWISTGTESRVAFNALKKNSLMVYPLSAKQMGNDGALVDVTAKSYQNGEWVDWILYLLHSDNYVGTWETNAYIPSGSGASASAPKITINEGELSVTPSDTGSNVFGICANSTPIDFSKYNTLSFEVYCKNENVSLMLIDANANGFNRMANYGFTISDNWVEFSEKIPTAITIGYIAIGAYRSSGTPSTTKFRNIRLT